MPIMTRARSLATFWRVSRGQSSRSFSVARRRCRFLVKTMTAAHSMQMERSPGLGLASVRRSDTAESSVPQPGQGSFGIRVLVVIEVKDTRFEDFRIVLHRAQLAEEELLFFVEQEAKGLGVGKGFQGACAWLRARRVLLLRGLASRAWFSAGHVEADGIVRSPGRGDQDTALAGGALDQPHAAFRCGVGKLDKAGDQDVFGAGHSHAVGISGIGRALRRAPAGGCELNLFVVHGNTLPPNFLN